MNTVEIRPNVAMAYEDHCFAPPWTSPQTIVMVHGNAESSRAWTGFVPHLAGKYRVVRPDMPGFGASPEPPGYRWQVDELADDLGRFLDALQIDKCHLVGAKYGGSVVMQYAIAHSDRLHSLALFGSPVRGSGTGNADKIRDLGVRGWAEATQRARLGSDASEAQIAWWTDELMGKTNPRAAYGASSARIGMELEQNLSRIACPALIVTTQESGLQSVAAVKAYAQKIPDARVVVLPGDCYHIAAAEPDVCADQLLKFLQEISATAGRKAQAGYEKVE
jgi:pimeloyl-ACP methyl ester carboxylesterase